MQIYLSSAKPWTCLTFGPSKVKIGLKLPLPAHKALLMRVQYSKQDCLVHGRSFKYFHWSQRNILLLV